MSASTEQIQVISGPIEYTIQFVPFDQSRNKGEKFPSLNWLYRVKIGHSILEGDYMQGCGHCPPSPIKTKVGEDRWRADICRTGKVPLRHPFDAPYLAGTGKPVTPPPLSDIISCLLLDGSTIDYPSFEEWAGEYGYDADSRKAEAMYRECLATGLKLRNALGDMKLSQLRELFHDY